MSITFFYAPMSTASITEAVIEELGIPVEKQLMSFKDGSLKQAEYLKLNPNGKVPCIVHDGVPIWESAAITMYLGEMFGVTKRLYPEPGPRRGEAMKWIAWANVTLGEAMYRRGFAGEWSEPALRNAKMEAKATEDIARLLGILDAALADRPFLLGNDYSLADTHLSSVGEWMRASKIDLSKYAHTTAWLGRCHARPAAQAIAARYAQK